MKSMEVNEEEEEDDDDADDNFVDGRVFGDKL